MRSREGGLGGEEGMQGVEDGVCYDVLLEEAFELLGAGIVSLATQAKMPPGSRCLHF